MIYAIINIALIIIIKAIYDKKQIKQGKGIAHKKEWRIVAAFSLPSIFIFSGGTFIPFAWGTPLLFIISAFMCMGFIWFFFDGLLNKLRGKAFWYTGIKFSGSAKSDGFLQRFTPGFQKVIKFSALLLPILIYVYSYFTKK